MQTMTVCRGCSRHVRQTECACPFCGAAVEPAAHTQGDAAPRGLSRGRLAVAVALTVAASATLAACYGAPSEPPDYLQPPDSGIAPRDAGPDSDAPDGR